MGERRPSPRHVGDELSAFLDDELDDAAALSVTRHLAACDPCVRELEGLRATRDALRGLPGIEPPSALFLDAAFAASPDARLPRSLRAAGVATVLLLVVLAGAFVAGEEAGTVRPPVDVFVADHVARTGGGPLVTPVRFDPAGR